MKQPVNRLMAFLPDQPPSGGWSGRKAMSLFTGCFKTQPPEGGWADLMFWVIHFHTKFQHTAARRRLAEDAVQIDVVHLVSTHSRPKAAGCFSRAVAFGGLFQHTAARRRLEL